MLLLQLLFVLCSSSERHLLAWRGMCVVCSNCPPPREVACFPLRAACLPPQGRLPPSRGSRCTPRDVTFTSSRNSPPRETLAALLRDVAFISSRVSPPRCAPRICTFSEYCSCCVLSLAIFAMAVDVLVVIFVLFLAHRRLPFAPCGVGCIRCNACCACQCANYSVSCSANCSGNFLSSVFFSCALLASRVSDLFRVRIFSARDLSSRPTVLSAFAGTGQLLIF